MFTNEVLRVAGRLIDELDGRSECKFSAYIEYVDEKFTLFLVLEDKENNLQYTERLTEKTILEIDWDYEKAFVDRAKAFFEHEMMEAI